MGEAGTIAIAFVHEALVEPHRRGLDVEKLLRDADVSPALLTSPSARVSAERYASLWKGIAAAMDDEFFGMDSRPVRCGSFKLLCDCILHAQTLGQALSRALRFLDLVMDDLQGQLVRDDNSARIVLTGRNLEKGSVDSRRPFAYGTYLLIVQGLACWLIGRRIPIQQARFCCDEPAFGGEWRTLFSPDLKFGQTETSLAFSGRFLDAHVVQTDASLKTFLSRAPANFLVKYQNSAGTAAKVRRRLRSVPPSCWGTFDEMAREFKLSSSTLRRRLEDEGETYRSIQDSLRMDMAINLLNASGRSIADIASDLGFAEASAFHRAFRKWTGVRPGEYRLGLQAS